MINVLGPLGVETSAVPTTDEEWSTLVSAMETDGKGVVVIRGLDATPHELDAILQKFAQVVGMRLLQYDRWPGQSPGVDGSRHLALLGNYQARTANDIVKGSAPGQTIAEFKPATLELSEWHTDGSFLAVPKTFIALYAPKQVEHALPKEGGETRFASCQLNAQQQEAYKGWTSVHSWKSFMRFLEARDPNRPKVTEAQCLAKPDVTWPLVRPTNGCLYINPKNTKAIYNEHGEEMDQSLVMKLCQDVVDTGVYWHKWQPGDLVIWDNQCLLHAATPFDSQKYQRLLYRAEFGPHYLPCCPETVVWGYMEQREAVMTVPSESVVVVDTVSANGSNKPPLSFQILPKELYEIQAKVTERVGPHVLTGPIAVTGAEPGDTLKIEVLEVRMRSDYAWTLHKKSGNVRHTKLLPAAGLAEPEWGGRLDCQPFFGVMGVAPPQNGRVSSIPPSSQYGGNLDLRLLTEGSTLYLPVHHTGALVFFGDGHARQGDGECCGTALETSLTGRFRLSVIKKSLSTVRAETKDSIIGIGISPNIDTAVANSLDNLVDWMLELRPTMARVDGECLCSVAANVSVTQIVNGATKGAHAVLRKSHLPPL